MINIPRYRYHANTQTIFQGNICLADNVPIDCGYAMAILLNAAYNKGYRDRAELIKEELNEMVRN